MKVIVEEASGRHCSEFEEEKKFVRTWFVLFPLELGGFSDQMVLPSTPAYLRNRLLLA
jgi:hypothetical protein